MEIRKMNVVVVLVLTSIGVIQANTFHFPDNFSFGVATAAYQIEGGWNKSGKGENIWDRITHKRPEWVKDGKNADIACDSYHLWKIDVQLLKQLGVDFYRFSLSWSRILPTGFSEYINWNGVRYYSDFIDELLANDIRPVVTLYHWDLPQPLQDLGGWPNLLIASYFEDYAKVAFQLFGDRVKTWITINEPNEICDTGYGTGAAAPGIEESGTLDYLCGKTVLIAHAKAYHLYDKYYRNKQKGEIGITIVSRWNEPKTNSTRDKEAAERTMQMQFGWWAHPIFSTKGDYPLVMKERIRNMSQCQNLEESRLPKFTTNEIEYIKGSSDFMGLNHYSTWLITDDSENNCTIVSYENDMGMKNVQDPSWIPSAASWLKDVPWGFRKLLQWIKVEYDNPLIHITENGFADVGELHDTGRIHYHRGYLNELLNAIHLDGCKIKSYALWSLMDNMEWQDGYTLKFGLYYVNFSDPLRTRTPKSSANFYKELIRLRRIPRDTPQLIVI
ncbi:hypothetical protein RI129_000883 [Pyrocoelia pectoralis]|uniref:Beta-glucosidase n=1 Tax=Pyrocoelia pectoralis TaxID=417401 RepID=A0AAN7VSQ1_9COLE